MTILDMIRIKEERGYSFQKLSEYSGVPVITIQKIFSGKTKNPRKATLDAIEKVLMAEESLYRGKAFEYASLTKNESPDIAESVMSYGVRSSSDSGEESLVEKKPGEYTLEDYYALPDERRVELIDGVFYDMAAPSYLHQKIVSYMHIVFAMHILKARKNCDVVESPVDVQILRDNKNMLQPDLIVLCSKDSIRRWGVYGAPDFVLEVLSKSTRLKDMSIKLEKYQLAGVREYWIVDPHRERLIIYNFMEEDFIPVIMPLVGEAEVAISDGTLKIDLGEIQEIITEFRDIQE